MTRFQLRWALLILLWVSFYVSCSSGTRQSNPGDYGTQNGSVSNIGDDEWNFKLDSKVPGEKTQRRIKCNGERVCWSWDEHTIWTGGPEKSWRQLHKLTSPSSSTVGITSVFLTTPTAGWVVKDNALHKFENEDSLRSVSVDGIVEGRDSIMSVYFADQNHGWIAGGKFGPIQKGDPLINTEMSQGQIRTAVIFETADSGITWRQLDLSRLIGQFDEVNFWDNRIGIASGRQHVVFTNDSGKSWGDATKHLPSISAKSEGGPPDFVSGFFLNTDNGWLLFSAFEFQVFSTRNGGKSWEKTIWTIKSQSQDTSSYPPPSRFVFVDDSHGLFVYNHMDGGELFKTSDGGKTWKEIMAKGSTQDVFFDLFFRKDVGGFLMSDKGVDSFSLK